MDSPEERFRMACTAQERAEALKECKDEKLIITALDNKDYIVREEAIRRVKDHDAFIQWILGGSSIIPVGAEVFWQRIDELNPEELGRLLDGLQKKHSNDAAYDILLKRVCRNLGHIPGPNCFCTRCGAELPHNFDENGVCRSCQAHIVEEEEILTEAGVEYAKRTNRKLVYSDGKIKHLDPSTIILVDDSTMAWLFPKD